MVDVDESEGWAIAGGVGVTVGLTMFGDVYDHGGQAGEGVVGVELDRVGVEERLVGVDGDLAGVIIGVLGEVGIPHVVVREALLRGAVGIVVGVDDGDGVEPGFLYE